MADVDELAGCQRRQDRCDHPLSDETVERCGSNGFASHDGVDPSSILNGVCGSKPSEPVSPDVRRDETSRTYRCSRRRCGENVTVHTENLHRYFVCEATVVELEHHVCAAQQLANDDDVAVRPVAGPTSMCDHSRELRTGEKPDGVDVVHHRLTDDLLDWPRRGVDVAVHRADVVDRPGSAEGVAYLHVGGVVLPHEPQLDQSRTGRPLCVDHTLGVFQGGGKRLFTEHSSALLDRGDAQIWMGDVWGRDDDAVDIGRRRQLHRVGEGDAPDVPSDGIGVVCVRVGHRDDVHASETSQRAGVECSHAAHPDDAHPNQLQFLHGCDSAIVALASDDGAMESPDRSRVVVLGRIPTAALDALRVRHHVWSWNSDDPLSTEQRDEVLVTADAAVALLNDRVDDSFLDAAPKLRVVSNVAVGYNNIDVAACARRGVIVTNTPGVLTDATADLAFGLLLAVTRRLGEGDRLIRSGQSWQWSMFMMLGTGLQHRQIGIVGMGDIGLAMARRSRAFGMNVTYHNRRPVHAAIEAELDARLLPLDELLSTSDVVSLHCPYNTETHHLIDHRALGLMQRSAYLINTARGPIVDESALVEALVGGGIAGAGLDVYEHEPIVHAGLLRLDNVALAPHLGSATIATRTDMAMLAARNVLEVLAGKAPLTPVAPPDR